MAKYNPVSIVSVSRPKPEPCVMQNGRCAVVVANATHHPNATNFTDLFSGNRSTESYRKTFVYPGSPRKQNFPATEFCVAVWTNHKSDSLWPSNGIFGSNWKPYPKSGILIEGGHLTKILHGNDSFNVKVQGWPPCSVETWSLREVDWAGYPDPWTLRGLHQSELALDGLRLVARSGCLLPYLPQREVCEHRKRDGYPNTQCLKAGLDPGPKGLLIALLGFIIFAYSYRQVRIGATNLNWQSWLFLIITGLLIFAYGMYVFADRPESAEILQLSQNALGKQNELSGAVHYGWSEKRLVGSEVEGYPALRNLVGKDRRMHNYPVGENMDTSLVGMLIVAFAITIVYCIAMLRSHKKKDSPPK
jgi:hypothetical protein